MKVMVYNFENFFIFMDKFSSNKDQIEELDEFKWQHLSTSLKMNKSLFKVKSIATLIKKHDPDIILCTEVGGKESLDNFNRYFLADTYQVFHKDSNSDRGIDMGYLVKKQVQVDELISYRNRPINFLYPRDLKEGKKLTPKTSLKFSRDVLRLSGKMNGEKFHFLLVHLKSKLDKEGKDPKGYLRREAELKELINIYQELQKDQCPIFIGGDFNGFAQKVDCDEEFKSIYQKTDLEDILDLQNIEFDKRFTHLYRNRHGQIFHTQLDYLFMQKSHKSKLITAKVDHYEDLINCDPSPQNLVDHRDHLPSDHFPIICELKLQ